MNEQQHWNKIASSYNDEIFDVFASDRKKLLPAYLKKHRKKDGRALDFGCGNGKAFRLLSPLFHHVTGSDISENLLIDASDRKFKNVTLLHRDLSDPEIDLPKSDFIFSCNVIMLPEAEANNRMLLNIFKALKKGGSCLLVVPSVESMMFSSWTLMNLYLKEGTMPQDINPEEFDYFNGTPQEISDGVFYIDGVPTRHYTAPQIEVMTREAGLKLTALERLEYNWESEIADPPKDLKDPYPWDWLVECKKDKKPGAKNYK
ncbi:MAG: class I SAM-dependent methyltransferase [Cyclobacteriaceae bacterium]